jgi:ABC-type sugar transport system ATPase subunit
MTDTTSPIFLQINHITKTFPKVVALDDVSLAAAPGEIHAVLGEEYAGKTTLMRTLGGLYATGSYQGEIVLDGKPLAARTPRDAIERGVTVVPRRLEVFDHLDIAENITMGNLGGKGFVINRAAIDRQAQQALDMIEVKLDLTAQPPQLSPGQQRLMMIARALCTHPRVIIMDEPATSLNTAEALGGLFRVIRLLSRNEITCLYLTRKTSEVLQIADRVSVLRDGAISGVFDRADLDLPTLTELMGSQQYRDYGHADDAEEPRGLDRWLRNLFGGPR